MNIFLPRCSLPAVAISARQWTAAIQPKGERMKLNKLALSGLIALGCAAAASNAVAQQRINVNIGASHPTTNIWAYAMKEVFFFFQAEDGIRDGIS